MLAKDCELNALFAPTAAKCQYWLDRADNTMDIRPRTRWEKKHTGPNRQQRTAAIKAQQAKTRRVASVFNKSPILQAVFSGLELKKSVFFAMLTEPDDKALAKAVETPAGFLKIQRAFKDEETRLVIAGRIPKRGA